MLERESTKHLLKERYGDPNYYRHRLLLRSRSDRLQRVSNGNCGNSTCCRCSRRRTDSISLSSCFGLQWIDRIHGHFPIVRHKNVFDSRGSKEVRQPQRLRNDGEEIQSHVVRKIGAVNCRRQNRRKKFCTNHPSKELQKVPSSH